MIKDLKWFFLQPSSSLKFPFGFEVSAPPFVIILAVLGFVASIIWIFRDAKERGKSGLMACLFAVVGMWPLSLIWWLWLRPPTNTKGIA